MLNLLPLICGIIGLLFALFYFSWVRRLGLSGKNNEHVVQHSVDEKGFFYRDDWMTIIIVIIVLSVILGICLGVLASILYLYGAIISVISELTGSHILSIGKRKFENTTGNDSNLFNIGFRTGISTGLFVASFGLLAFGAIFLPFNYSSIVDKIACFGFGVSTVALFNESKFIFASDLFDSYIWALLSTVILADVASNTAHITSTFTTSISAVFPLLIAGVGVIASIIGTLFVWRKDKGNITIRINVGNYVAGAIILVAAFFLSTELLQSYLYAVVLALGVICGIVTGLSSIKKMSILPVVIFTLSIVCAYKFIGLYGIVLISVGFASMITVLIASSSYGLITDAKSNIVSVANGYATSASSLSAVALFVAYITLAKINNISLTDPLILAGLLVGGTIPMSYAAIFARNRENKQSINFVIKLTSFAVPGIVGMLFGAESLGAFLGGLIASGMVSSLIFNDIGINKDSTDENSVSVGTSVNILIKYMSAFSLVFAPVFIKFGGILY